MNKGVRQTLSSTKNIKVNSLSMVGRVGFVLCCLFLASIDNYRVFENY